MTNPSRHQLPQHASPDRRRARLATLALERSFYEVEGDAASGHPSQTLHLPPAIASLPKADTFGPEKLTRLLLHKLAAQAQAPFVRIVLAGSAMDSAEDYRRVCGWLNRPRTMDAWRSDADFARQRLQGVNPKSLFRWEDPPGDALAAAMERVLDERHGTRFSVALDAGRLFGTDYPLLQEPLIQQQVRPGLTLAAPTCAFYADEAGDLWPLAIRLRPESAPEHPVLTPLDAPGDWLLARAHAQSADAHYHEGVYHLLETHMVSEMFALASARNLHPDHPLRQLLHVHFEWNLAIDDLARRDLLSVGGPIDQVFAAGVGGVLDLARMVWSDWSFEKRGFRADLAQRGVADKPLEKYFYREDGGQIYAALEAYADRILRLWYQDEEDEILADFELQNWAKALSKWIPNGFPAAITSRSQLVSIAAEIIFRASAGHAAVNNGQFDNYGFVPNSPGALAIGLPGTSPWVDPVSEREVLAALPGIRRTQTAIGMSWVLSQPTHRSLLTTGDTPAFEAALNPAAHDAVDAVRSRLRRVSAEIGVRNRGLEQPYTYLDPKNVGRSAGI